MKKTQNIVGIVPLTDKVVIEVLKFVDCRPYTIVEYRTNKGWMFSRKTRARVQHDRNGDAYFKPYGKRTYLTEIVQWKDVKI